MAGSVQVSAESFAEAVLASKKPVLVHLWADWCEPCHMLAPVLEEIADEYDETLWVARLDIDENPALADEYKVMSIPTLILFKQGKLVKQLVGTRPKASLLEALAGLF
jgi:thioredoxin 1